MVSGTTNLCTISSWANPPLSCLTSTSTSTSILTSISTSTSKSSLTSMSTPNPMPTPWANISCTDPSYSQTLSDETRWNNVNASLAWSEAIVAWQILEYQGSTFSFSQAIANFFGSPSDVTCTDPNTGSTCSQYVNCVNPAAYDAILRSFTYLHDYYANFLIDINTGLTWIQGKAPIFSITFALQISDAPSSSFDFLEVNSKTKVASFFTTAAKSIKDVVNPIAVGSIVLASSTVQNAINIDEEAVFASLENYLTVIVNALGNATTATLETLFDGSGISMDQLQAIISDGSIMSAQNPSGPDWENGMEAIMFGYLAPIAWSLSNQNLCPFILDYSHDYGSGCPGTTYFDLFISARVCFNDRTYFLLNANSWSYDGSSTFGLLPGTPDLLGATYTVTLNNIVNGAVNGYNANGQQNFWQYPNGAEESVVNSFINSIRVEQPGLINIPVCPASNVKPCCPSVFT